MSQMKNWIKYGNKNKNKIDVQSEFKIHSENQLAIGNEGLTEVESLNFLIN